MGSFPPAAGRLPAEGRYILTILLILSESSFVKLESIPQILRHCIFNNNIYWATMKIKYLQICLFTLLFLCISSLANAEFTSDHLSQIQQKLIELGYDPGPVDGILGPKTIKAVRQFQIQKSLPATGKLDDETIAALGLRLLINTQSQMQAGEPRNTIDESPLTEPNKRQQPKRSVLLSIPFSWYFVSGIILSIIAFFIVKRIEHAERKKGWSYFFAQNSLEFLIPFVAVSAFYSMLALSLSTYSKYLSLETLIRFETLLSEIKSLIDILNFKPLTVLVIFLLLFTFGVLGVAPHGLDKAAGAFGRYQKITRRIYTVIVLLCSLTLLGTYAGVPTNDLRVRIKTVRDGYADLVENTESILTAAAADEILKNARDQFPESYKSALATSLILEEDVSELDKYYRSEKEKWNIRLASAEMIIKNRGPKPKVIIFKADSSSVESSEKKAQLRNRAPHWVSSQKMEKLKSRVKASGMGIKPYFVEFLKDKTGRKIACQIPKVFTNEIRNSIVRQCAARYPILEPLVDVVVNSFDDKITGDIEEAAVRMTDSGLKQPENSPKMLKEEVRKLTAAQKLSIKNDVIKTAENLGKKTQRQYEELKKTRAQIENRVKSAQSGQINTLISQLKNPSPDIRVKASRKLSKLGDIITRDDFSKIVDVMYNGKDESRKELYRQSHCTWYEYTQSRYYAAETLLAMNSPHVSDRIVTDAKQAKANGRYKGRVTEPGWV